jgi:hypothetical protein
MHTSDEAFQTAYTAAVQAAASAAARNLLALEAADPDIGAVMVECHSDGAVAITLLSKSGHPVGGYSL